MYVAFEGIDGCGKDTQIALLENHLKALNRKIKTVCEPSKEGLGLFIRDLLFQKDPCDKAHLPLFVADRLILQNKHKELLDQGFDIILSRSFLSTFVYQKDSWDYQFMEDLHRYLEVKPQVIILLDIDPEISASRLQSRTNLDCFENKERLIPFRKRYMYFAEMKKSLLGVPIVVVNAEGSPQEVHARVLEALTPFWD